MKKKIIAVFLQVEKIYYGTLTIFPLILLCELYVGANQAQVSLELRNVGAAPSFHDRRRRRVRRRLHRRRREYSRNTFS